MTRKIPIETCWWLRTPDLFKHSIPVWVLDGIRGISGEETLVYAFPASPDAAGAPRERPWTVLGYGRAEGLDSSDVGHFPSAREALEWTHTWMLMHVPDYDGAVGGILEMMQGRDPP